MTTFRDGELVDGLAIVRLSTGLSSRAHSSGGFFVRTGLSGSLLWGHVIEWLPEAGGLGSWSLVESDAGFRFRESVLLWLDFGTVFYIGTRGPYFNTAPMA